LLVVPVVKRRVDLGPLAGEPDVIIGNLHSQLTEERSQ